MLNVNEHSECSAVPVTKQDHKPQVAFWSILFGAIVNVNKASLSCGRTFQLPILFFFLLLFFSKLDTVTPS